MNNTFFLFKLFYNQYTTFKSPHNKIKIVFLVIFKILNTIIYYNKYKKALIRSPHVDKKSKEKFIAIEQKISFFSNISQYKKIMLKTLLILNWFNIFLQKKIKKQQLLIFYKKFFIN